MTSRTKIILSAIFVGLLILAGFAYVRGQGQTSEDSGATETLSLGVEASLLPASVWVAENKGYFQEEGIDLSIKEFDSGRLSFNAMLAGEGVDISTVAPTPIMFTSFGRQDFSILAVFAFSSDDIKVIARGDKGISTAVDLIGKRIGTAVGTTGQFFLGSYLTRNGILVSEVEVVDFSPSELPGALENNEVDAIVIWEPHAYNAQQLLGNNTVRLPSANIYRTAFNFTVMNSFAEARPDVLESFLRAIIRATEFINSNKDESIIIVAERLGLDRVVTTALWDDFTFDVFLDQSLLLTLEAEANWAIENNLADNTVAPNYLDYFFFKTLEEVSPETITIVH